MSFLKMNQHLFLKSALTGTGAFGTVGEVLEWLKLQNEKVTVNIRKSSFSKLSKWHYDAVSDSLRHETGGFFSIEGIQVQTNWGPVPAWNQPIINQPEIGYLGFITKEIEGTLHFLVQAKIEPGNVNFVQLSPTLQATRSNYNQIHQGKKPKYLEFFQKAKSGQILLDQLQSEQGARFLRKRNRNIIIKTEENLPAEDNFIWLTLGQIKLLMQVDNVVNMDTRTVISGIPYGEYESETINLFHFLRGPAETGNPTANLFLKSALTVKSHHTIEEIISFITRLKSTYDLFVKNIGLKKLDDWIFSDNEIYHRDHKYFKVIAVDVEIGNREVVAWSQPMVEPAQEGLCAFLCREIDGVLHFAVQAKLECGNHDIIELAPTVQCLTGNYRHVKENNLPFLNYVLNAKPSQIVFDTLQSEEGGRFFREQNRNLIVLAGDDLPGDLPEKFIWMTLGQLHTFLKFNNYLNIQARSLIASISFI